MHSESSGCTVDISPDLVFFSAPDESALSRNRDSPGYFPLPLGDSDRLTSMLKVLTSGRESIANVMVFCVDRSESAADIVKCIVEAKLILLDSEIGRLYALSDILYNSNSDRKFAWILRSEIQGSLPRIFVRLRECREKCGTEVLRGRLMDRVHRVISAWRDWRVFDERFLKGLLFQFDDVRLNLLNYEVLTVPDPPDVVAREMKAYGLDSRSGYELLEQFRMLVLGEDCDIDGESLDSELELEEKADSFDLDGEPYLPSDSESVHSPGPEAPPMKLSFTWKQGSDEKEQVAEQTVKTAKNISKVDNIEAFFVESSKPLHPLDRRRRRSRTPPTRKRQGRYR